MTAHLPPVPPDQRSDKATGASPAQRHGGEVRPPRDPNTAEQGRQGNIKQNTTHQGHQQDR
ncbi:conserved protein of unknown function [Rhodovastum atsumiense]|uniref:Uncharacterized protein n=1 Tax=Rhodovastum atsumiense TaxID=504468 RepID=A0A5M6IM37_9PROT|nr:hypothetical protein [Rhodovastum atsumiense]KAA5609007.1 hypothetical protein F1189_26360 [Rhodovastum atsumiense]CAH2599077.1 conserved protein of unknown function [Rhodovastum atsumiense]